MTRRERERLRRREEIIDAAEKLFFEKGYSDTTIEEIGKAAEYSRRTLYTYFRSKDDLYMAVHLRYTRMKTDQLRRSMQEHKTGFEKLNAYGQAYYEFFDAHPEYLRFQLFMDVQGIDFDQLSDETISQYEELNRSALSHIREAFELGRFDHSIAELGPDEDIFLSYLFIPLRSVINIAVQCRDTYGLFVQGVISPRDYFFKFFNRLMGTIKP